MTATRRLFAGIALDDAARTACAATADRLRQTGFAARYEDSAKLHVTLAFLGNVEAQRACATALALREAAGSAPFDLIFDRLGAFPHERKPRVVFIGARDRGAAFRTLARAVRDAFARLGYAFDDDAVAHVTVARVKDPRRSLPLVEVAPIVIEVRALTLFESHFDKAKNTSRYDVFSSVALSGRQT